LLPTLRKNGLDLQGANFRNADRSGADLHDSHFAGADFSSANLNSACLAGADLTLSNGLAREQIERAIVDENTACSAPLRDRCLAMAKREQRCP
jgi:uncharacterized protein YjbI with pentapeptide repeats